MRVQHIYMYTCMYIHVSMCVTQQKILSFEISVYHCVMVEKIT